MGPRSLVYMHLLRPPKGMKRAREIRGVVRVSYGFGRDVMTIEDVLRGGERSATEGTSTLAARIVAQHDTALWLRLSETEDGKRVNPMVYPASSAYGVQLVDPNGGRHAGVVQWRGSMRRVGQIMGPDGKTEGGMLVRGVGVTTLWFVGLPAIAGKWRLEHSVPEKVVVREYPFVFRDVPLPEGIERGPRKPPAAGPAKE